MHPRHAHTITSLWRPIMGWMYTLICFLDMAVFPVLWSLWQAVNHQIITQWVPLTLQGGGLFHIAMGAVLGISAYGRTQEKIAGVSYTPPPLTNTIATPQQPQPGFAQQQPVFTGNTTVPVISTAQMPPTFGSTIAATPAAPISSAPPTFGSSPATNMPPPAFGGTTTVAGKMAPVQPTLPEI